MLGDEYPLVDRLNGLIVRSELNTQFLMIMKLEELIRIAENDMSNNLVFNEADYIQNKQELRYLKNNYRARCDANGIAPHI